MEFVDMIFKNIVQPIIFIGLIVGVLIFIASLMGIKKRKEKKDE